MIAWMSELRLNTQMSTQVHYEYWPDFGVPEIGRFNDLMDITDKYANQNQPHPLLSIAVRDAAAREPTLLLTASNATSKSSFVKEKPWIRFRLIFRSELSICAEIAHKWFKQKSNSKSSICPF